MMCIYNGYAFSDVVKSNEFKYDIGMSALFLAIIVCGTNLGNLLYRMGLQLIAILRKCN